MANPFKRVVQPMRTSELIDLCFRRAFSRKHLPKIRRSIEEIAREREIARIRSMTDTAYTKLVEVVKSFPTVEKVHPFYRELAHVLVDIDEIRKSLAAIQWAAELIRRLSGAYIKRLSRVDDPVLMAAIRREFTGRFSSVLKQVSENLDYLVDSINKLRKLPDINLELPTVVLAGMPNTGKSTLVRKLSSADPEIAPYPFTTKGLIVGHNELPGVGKVQFIDTPGLLDRPISSRNKIERQAILALRYLGDVIIYIFDPTETCGYSIESQMSLYKEIKREFDKPIIVICNKSDVKELFRENVRKIEEEIGRVIKISAELGDGIEELRGAIWSWLKRNWPLS